MRQIFFLLFLLCTWEITTASTNQLDSLYLIAKNQIGEQKLNTLAQIATTTNGVEKINAANELRKEATLQSNHLYMAKACQEVANCFSESHTHDSVKHYIDKGLHVLEKIDVPNRQSNETGELYHQLIFELNRALVKYYMRTDKYYLALAHVQRMLEKSQEENDTTREGDLYFLLGMVYSFIEEPNEAIEYLQKSVNLNISSKDPLPLILIQGCHIILKQYDEALALTDSIEHFLKKEKPLTNLAYSLFAAYYNSAYSHLQKGNLVEARVYINQAFEVRKGNQNDDLKNYLEAEYYYAAKKYYKALEYIDMAIPIDNQPSLNGLGFIEARAKILRAMNRGDEAYDQLKETSQKRDSIKSQRFAALLTEFEVIHRANKLEHELVLNQEKLHSSQLLVGGLILVVVLVMAVTAVIWRGNRKLRTKNIDLYKRHKRMEEVSLEMENLRNSQLLAENDPNSSLILKLDKYMKESEFFLNPEITRNEVALELGTNRQYLINAIKEKKEQTFNEYIYSWRLKYAYNLITNDHSLSIGEIFSRSGFASRRVFNREFKKEYSMTPFDLRTAAQEDNSKQIE